MTTAAMTKSQEAAGAPAGMPDMKVSVRQVFGIDSDLEVPAYSAVDPHVPDVDADTVSIAPPRLPSSPDLPRTAASW